MPKNAFVYTAINNFYSLFIRNINFASRIIFKYNVLTENCYDNKRQSACYGKQGKHLSL